MDTTLAAEARTPGKKGVARKLRKTGKMPAVVYGPDHEPVHIAVDPIELGRIFRVSNDRNTVVELKLEGKNVPTLVRQVQRHPVSRDLVHVDFYRVDKKRKVDVMVPIVGVGRPAGALLGGRLRIIRRVVKARCDFDKIPKTLEIDISPMNIGDMILASDVLVPTGVELVYDNDFNVLTLYGKSVKLDPALDGPPADDEAADGDDAAETAEA